jgi:hypothetical protein
MGCGSSLQEQRVNSLAMHQWMRQCEPQIGGVLLKNLRIPGTHDSFTSNIGAPIAGGWMVCQKTSVEEQLAMGVRYFDCRVRADDDEFWTYHGLKSDRFEPILLAVRSFLDEPEHSKEILILDMSHFDEFKPGDAARLADLVHSIFGQRLIPSTIDLDKATLSQLWEQPGRVVVLFDDAHDSGELVWHKPSRSDRFYSYWTNKPDQATLVAANTVVLSEQAPGWCASRLFVLQCQITAPETNFVKWLMKNGLDTLEDLAKGVNAHYMPWLQETDPTKTRINIVIADFVDEEYCRAVITPYVIGTSKR